MDTFGDRLKTEREARGLSIQAVSETLGVDTEVLLALERNDYQALPDESAMSQCLNRYADCLDVDAELMIADYAQERHRALVTRSGSAATRAEAGARLLSPLRLGVVAVAVVALLATWWLLSRDGTASGPVARVAGDAIEVEPLETPVAPPPVVSEPLSTGPPSEPQAPTSETPTEPESPSAEAPITTRPASTGPQADRKPEADAETAPAIAPAASEPSPLRVRELGLGTAVENQRLVGEGERFREGARVYFWTRVLGGARGDRIDHVWLRKGRAVARVSLPIGGSTWSTHSFKTLYPASAGDWAVEARDEEGRLLARREFVCVP